MARHPRAPSPSPSASPPRAPSDPDAGFDPIEEWLVDFDQAMSKELAVVLGLAEEPAVGKVSEGDLAAESGGVAVTVKEEAVEVEEKVGSPGGQLGASPGGDLVVKEEPEVMSCGLGGQPGPDQIPSSIIGGGVAAKDGVSEEVVDAEMNTAAADAEAKTAAADVEMNTAVSAKEEMVGVKEESSEDEEEDEGSSEDSSSSEEDDDDEGAKKDEESSEALSSSDEEEPGASVDIEALLEEGELMLGGDDDEEEAPKGPIKSKHEEVLPPVPKIEVQLEPHHKTLPVGAISAIMGERVIVEGSVQHNPLNEGSILWITKSRTPLGIVDELFGPVKNPYYLVRYNSVEEVPVGIGAGTAVSFVTEFADHILNMKELYSKGYDASGDNDDQSDEPEFSDDEKEAEYKRSLRTAKRQTDRQHVSKKPYGDKKRAQPKGAGFRKDMPPRINDASPTTGHQSRPHFHRSDVLPVGADNGTRPLGSQNFPTNAPMVLPPAPMNPALPAAVHLANQMGGCFINLSQQFLPQQPNVVWPGGLPPLQRPNMGVDGAALAANIMHNMLLGANQYQQQFQNQNFGGIPNQMPIPPLQFMPKGGMPANPMPFRGHPVNPPFGPAPPLLGQGNFGPSPRMVGEQGTLPGFPSTHGLGCLPTPHGDGEQPHMQFNSGQFNQGNSSFRGRSPHKRGGRHSPGRGRGQHHR